ncbi:MAG: 2-oxo acid dehydrogenase subunit E2 [Acetivibrionales bacterium]|jgi:pyruvate dehydrogenase E2 component (dihydrolipoamide acetyltransferase)
MAVPVIMPKQGQSVESCIITKWHKNKGDKVKAGDLLFSYETDKAAFDEEAKAEGVLLEIFFGEGDDVPVLTNVCVIGSEGEDIREFDPRGKPASEEAEAVSTAQSGKARETPGTHEDARPSSGSSPNVYDSKIKISPRARKLAEKIGADYISAYKNSQGTGPEGRIIERDIEAMRLNGPIITHAAREEYLTHIKSEAADTVAGTGIGGRITAADLETAAEKIGGIGRPVEEPWKEPGKDYVEIQLTNIRKAIAIAMHRSLSESAQLTLNTSFDATEILSFRKKLKAEGNRLGIESITLNDIILYAVSRTLPNHGALNAHFFEDRMLVFNSVHLGVAVDTERGLMVPTIFNADRKSLGQISAEAKKLAEDCRKGTINPDLLKGGSFTVTNLGVLGIESFTPVLNPPQTGILGVNSIVQRVRESDGEYTCYPAMTLSLTFDHRAVDGAPAARFLRELKTNLENFSILLAK